MLTVVSIGYPLAPVGPDFVGGSEQIVSALDAALVEAGHRSIVIACAGSSVRGELVELPAPGTTLTQDAWVAAHEAVRAALRQLLQREHVDVVHAHGVDFHAYLPPPGPAVLATLHLPIDWYPPHIFASGARGRPDTYLCCVSYTQRASAPANAAIEVIENGVDLDQLRPSEVRGNYALVLGRICPEKAPHLAIDAANRAGVALRLAGRVFGFPEHQAYFRDHVLPRLAVPHTFVGAVAGETKRQLIANARCVVIPSLVAETSSLVAMEAFACGTPVIAFRRGALVELVEHGRTGFLVDDADGLARAIGDAGRLDRAACRAVAEARCSRRRMCERYLARYRELAAASAPRRLRRHHVEVVDGTGLSALERDWANLWDRAGSATAFQRPDWCVPWCEHLLHGDVQCVTVWRGSTLEALAPLFRWRDGDVEVLSLIGAGVSDYQDALVATEADDEVTSSLEHALAAMAWGRMELSELRDRSVLLRLALPGREELVAQDVCPALPLGKGRGLDVVAPALRKEIEYQRRRVARELGLEQVALSADAASEALAALHRARWAQRGQTGVIGDATEQFLRAATRRLALGRMLMATGVRIGRELAAIALGIVDRDCLRYYLGGFSPAHERRSPGLLAIAAAIEEASTRGLEWFDFLRGSEHYKYRFGAQDRTHLVRRVVHRS